VIGCSNSRGAEPLVPDDVRQKSIASRKKGIQLPQNSDIEVKFIQKFPKLLQHPHKYFNS
jgi:hypothetical protein